MVKKQVLIYDSNGGKQYWDNWDTVKSALADYGVDNDSVTVVKTGGVKA